MRMSPPGGLLLPFVLAGAVEHVAAEDAAHERKTFREAFRTFAADGRYLVTFPARTNPKGVWLTLGIVAATGLTMNRDDEIRERVVESDSRTAGRIATKFEPL